MKLVLSNLTKVPAGVSVRDKRLSTNLKIESNACIDFSHSVEIPIGKKKLLASLRTDKLKYHPGEFGLLMLRIFAINIINLQLFVCFSDD